MRRIRHRRRRRMGFGQHRPRHRRVHGRQRRTLVAHGRLTDLPAGQPTADLRRRRRLERLPQPRLQDRTGRACHPRRTERRRRSRHQRIPHRDQDSRPRHGRPHPCRNPAPTQLPRRMNCTPHPDRHTPTRLKPHVGLTPDGGHLTGGTSGPAGRMSVCRASAESTPRVSGAGCPPGDRDRPSGGACSGRDWCR